MSPTTWRIRLTLKSDATFGRGDGVAGVVDTEVQQDRFGLPYLSGKTLKGLLGAECAEIISALRQVRPELNGLPEWELAAQFLFGCRGSRVDESGQMYVSDARLPTDLCDALAAEFRNLEDKEPGEREREWGKLSAINLDTLTALRRQTAMNPETGAPLRNALRASRVILRGTPFEAYLTFAEEPSAKAKCLLAACVRALHRAGTGRNRGRGRLYAQLFGATETDVTQAWLDELAKEVQSASADI